MPVISVIVPVYKVETYLRQCVDSILNQTYTDFELILVDDGSPDNCGAICDEYAAQDKRVHVIHQRNGGLSAARNSGIQIAQGEFIAFIDSDDLIPNDYLEKLLSAAVTSASKVVICGTESFQDGDSVSLSATSNGEIEIKTGTETCLTIYREPMRVAVTAWGKLYRRELFLEARFPVGKIHEDQFIIPRIIYSVPLVVIIHEQLYKYRVRPDSISTVAISRKRFDDIEGIDQCIEFYKTRKEKKLVKAATTRRNELLARFTIFSLMADMNDIPDEYRISSNKALWYLWRRYPDKHFVWWLAQVYPALEGPFYKYMRLKQYLHIPERKC